MTNIEFKKYGNGSQVYEVLMITSHCETTKRSRFTSIGFIQKVGRQWEAMDGKVFTGKTRKEVAEKLAVDYKLKNA